MSDITINVEFMAGTEVKSAIEQAKALARKLGVAYVCFEFNGANFSVSPKAVVNKLCDDYKVCMHVVG